MVERIPRHVKILAAVFAVVTFIYIMAPLVVVAGVSLSDSEFIVFPPRGLTLRWYADVLGSSRFTAAAWTSLQLAILVTASATTIGAFGAIAIHRNHLPFNSLFGGLFLAPLILPSIVLAIGLLLFWSTTVGPVSFPALWLGHTVVALPYVIRTMLAVLGQSDPSLEEAARTLGASRLQVLALVTLPQCAPGLAAGAFFAFNISFDEAILALFLRTPELTTLPIQIYNQLEFSPDPTVAAVSTLMIIVTIGLIIVIDRLIGIEKAGGA